MPLYLLLFLMISGFFSRFKGIPLMKPLAPSALIAAVARQRQVVGMDLVEFAPIRGLHVYDFTAADLAYKMMGIVERANPQQK